MKCCQIGKRSLEPFFPSVSFDDSFSGRRQCRFIVAFVAKKIRFDRTKATAGNMRWILMFFFSFPFVALFVSFLIRFVFFVCLSTQGQSKVFRYYLILFFCWINGHLTRCWWFFLEWLVVCAFSCSRSDERRTHFEGKTARVFGFFFFLFVFFF